jgi:hydrogenase-1 operon protein HyaF
MKTSSIPVRVVGAGSQLAEAETLQYLDMPQGMTTFRMPLVPERADAAAIAAARELLAQFLADIEGWDFAEGVPGPRREVRGLSAAALAIVDQMLGEGEVGIHVAAPRAARIQESVFTGIWRVCELGADGMVARDYLEAAPVPAIALAAAHAAAARTLVSMAPADGTMNAPALLHEIGSRMRKREAGAPAHVINLTLFPMTPEDLRMLEQAFPPGPVAMMSRGFGNCRIGSTLARDVWRVQYFNNMNTLILNTIEVVDVPEVAVAAVEDLQDSRVRLAELVAWMDESGDA